jgi:hypothetical protein
MPKIIAWSKDTPEWIERDIKKAKMSKGKEKVKPMKVDIRIKKNHFEKIWDKWKSVNQNVSDKRLFDFLTDRMEPTLKFIYSSEAKGIKNLIKKLGVEGWAENIEKGLKFNIFEKYREIVREGERGNITPKQMKLQIRYIINAVSEGLEYALELCGAYKGVKLEDMSYKCRWNINMWNATMAYLNRLYGGLRNKKLFKQFTVVNPVKGTKKGIMGGKERIIQFLGEEKADMYGKITNLVIDNQKSLKKELSNNKKGFVFNNVSNILQDIRDEIRSSNGKEKNEWRRLDKLIVNFWNNAVDILESGGKLKKGDIFTSYTISGHIKQIRGDKKVGYRKGQSIVKKEKVEEKVEEKQDRPMFHPQGNDKVKCSVCGAVIKRSGISAHKKTKKHTNALQGGGIMDSVRGLTGVASKMGLKYLKKYINKNGLLGFKNCDKCLIDVLSSKID